jgi:hypothetical protein
LNFFLINGISFINAQINKNELLRRSGKSFITRSSPTKRRRGSLKTKRIINLINASERR